MYPCAQRGLQAFIRKSYLCNAIQYRLSKFPESILAHTVPTTYPFLIKYADELDELFYDELYDVKMDLDHGKDRGHGVEQKWWILKPAMADKAQGIRLFDTEDSLRAILDAFEEHYENNYESDDDNNQGQHVTTKVSLTMMQDWVIQVRIRRVKICMHIG